MAFPFVHLGLVLDDGEMERRVPGVVFEVDDVVEVELAVADGGHQLHLPHDDGLVEQGAPLRAELGVRV